MTSNFEVKDCIWRPPGRQAVWVTARLQNFTVKNFWASIEVLR